MKNEHLQNIEHGKIPPQCVELEEAVLGAIITNRNAILNVIDVLTENSFYSEKNKQIYKAINELYSQSKPIDLLTVIEQLKTNKQIELAGGAYGISQLTNKVSSSANIEEHALIIKQYEIKRKIIELSQELLGMAYSEHTNSLELVEMYLDSAYELTNFESTKIKTNSQLILEVAKGIENAAKNKGITGVATGLDDVDKIFGGYQKTDLIIKAARPAMGKTAQALCEAMYMAYVLKKNVAFFSLEMGAEQLMKRIISIHSEIYMSKIKTGEFTEYDWKNFTTKTADLTDDNMMIYDRCFNLNSIIKECKKLAINNKLDIVYIDYLQLVEHSKKQNSNREQDVSAISRRLKLLAKELNIPIVVLSQLSRAVETRGGNKRPQLSDLRESGSIEQDADIVQFLYRPEYYGITEDENGYSTKGLAQMIVAKHRNGICKDINMRFIGSLTKFTNYEEQEISNSFPTKIKPNAEF